VEEITEDAEVVARVAALDVGKATLTACARVPHDDKPGPRPGGRRGRCHGRWHASPAREHAPVVPGCSYLASDQRFKKAV
jgi:hypothetical protein